MANLQLQYGGCYFSTPATTTLSAATAAKASGTTTSTFLNGFSHTNNRLTYTGTATLKFMVTAAVSAKTITGADTVEFWIYKNGSEEASAHVTRKVANNDEGAVCVNQIFQLATNDYIELWVETLAGDDLQVTEGSLTAIVVG